MSPLRRQGRRMWCGKATNHQPEGQTYRCPCAKPRRHQGMCQCVHAGWFDR